MGGSRDGDSKGQPLSLPPSGFMAGVFHIQSQVDHCHAREPVRADDFRPVATGPSIQGKKVKN